MATRARNQLWLLDKAPIAEIVCPRLPSKEQCLLLYFHHHQEGRTTKSESIRLVVQAIWPIWEKPTSNCHRTCEVALQEHKLLKVCWVFSADLFGLRMSDPMLKSLSTAAEEARGVVFDEQVMATRARNQLWLLDKAPIAEIVCPRLPSKEQCLLLYFHHHQEGRKTKSESIRLVVQAIWPIWEKANLPTTTKKYAGENWRTSSKVPQEDKDFLTSQREDRMSSSLAGVDQKTVKKKAEKRKRDLAALARKTKSDAKVTQLMEVVHLEADGSSIETNTEDEDDADETYQVPSIIKAQTPKRRRRKALADPNFIAAWDRDNLSVRQATSSFAAAAQSLGHDLE
ncbi:hypothetical protein GWK47_023148 [Chionoecetes opilio]|uniref:Uncharacterized protein n=1 Tax=Chionoecetes opilio TaxID=41210 RepID=A0A8J4XPT6_CHIOP|nr:hypothetical protein GWK47_023148 [Chionoecetes opilio]